MEIGGLYPRLCARAIWPGGTVPRWWPVLGPLHDDREILGLVHEHYHVDYRFLRAEEVEIQGPGGDPGGIDNVFAVALIRKEGRNRGGTPAGEETRRETWRRGGWSSG